MKNRIASLFDLDQLLEPVAPSTRHMPAPSQAAPASRKRPTCRPGKPKAVSQSFDTGAPINCQHDVSYTPVQRADVDVPSDTPPPARASALDLHVEAFEDDAEEESPSMRLTYDEEATESLALDYGDAGDREVAHAPTTPEPDAPEETVTDTRAESESFAAQMAAVEADLAELASRADHPRPNAPTPPDEEAARTTPAAPSERKGHGVFDSMAQGMAYATEFRLPSVQLSQVFTALDRQLDADRTTESTGGAGTVAPDGAAVPATPGGDVLLADLVRLTPPARPAPVRDDATPVAPIAQALGPAIDVRHQVQLVPQQTGMSCWAAGAAMVVGWRDKVSIDPSEIARANGYWAQYANGLNAEDTGMFATWRLTPEAAQSYSVQGFADLLRRHGPLWVASAEPGPHVRVVTGMIGDGTPLGTQVLIHDPWEAGMTSFRTPNAGATYSESYQRFIEKQETLGRREARLQGIYVAHA